jgi:lipopolysaccharide transport system permease protein
VAFGLSLFLASLYPYFRDLAEIWPFVIQLGFFLCPIIYPLSLVPKAVLSIYLLNPITQIMTMYRDIVLYGVLPSFISVWYIFLFGISIVITGHYLFKKLEKRFVEVI